MGFFARRHGTGQAGGDHSSSVEMLETGQERFMEGVVFVWGVSVEQRACVDERAFTTYLSIWLIYLSVCLSIYRSIYLSISLSLSVQ